MTPTANDYRARAAQMLDRDYGPVELVDLIDRGMRNLLDEEDPCSLLIGACRVRVGEDGLRLIELRDALREYHSRVEVLDQQVDRLKATVAKRDAHIAELRRELREARRTR